MQRMVGDLRGEKQRGESKRRQHRIAVCSEASTTNEKESRQKRNSAHPIEPGIQRRQKPKPLRKASRRPMKINQPKQKYPSRRADRDNGRNHGPSITGGRVEIQVSGLAGKFHGS
jgi:hypothetical protein